MNTELNHQQSLSLINEMISQARNNFQRGSGSAMVFNGCLVAFTALLNVALIFVLPNPNYSFFAWCLMIPGWFADRLIDRKVGKRAIVRTHIDKIITSIWRGFGIAVLVFLAVIFGYGISMGNAQIFVLITPVMMLMTGLAEFITAKACRFKPFLVGALIMWAGALACMALHFVLPHPYSVMYFLVVMAVCIIFAFVIPGCMLNKKAKENV